MCTKEKIAQVEELRLQALEAQKQLERIPKKYASNIDASDKTTRALQDVKALVLALEMARDTLIDMCKDIDAALKINDDVEKKEIADRVSEAERKAKKAYDHKRYLQKKREQEAENE